MVDAILAFLGSSIMAIFGWAFSLNSRMGVQEKAHEDLVTLINTKLDAVEKISKIMNDKIDSQFDAQGKRLDRIERSMNGHLVRE